MNETVNNLPEEVKFGIAGALFYILANFAFYLSGIHVFQNLTLDVLTFLTVIAISVSAAWYKRKRYKGSITFMEASFTVMITYLIIEVCFSAFYFSLFTYIDPQLGEKLRAHHIEQLKMHSQDAEALEKQIEIIRDTDYNVNSAVVAGRLLANMLVGMVIALISGAFLRKEESSGLTTLE